MSDSESNSELPSKAKNGKYYRVIVRNIALNIRLHEIWLRVLYPFGFWYWTWQDRRHVKTSKLALRHAK